MALEVVTPAAELPVSLQEYKKHLRVDLDIDDTFITGLGAGAVDYTEQTTSRTMVDTVFKLTLDAIPASRAIELPRSDATSITSVTIIDEDGDSNVVDGTVYELNKTGVRHYVVLSAGQDWPTHNLQAAGAIEVVFNAGYEDAASVPASLKAALKLLVKHYYDIREPFIVGTIIATVPLSYEALVATYTVGRTF